MCERRADQRCKDESQSGNSQQRSANCFQSHRNSSENEPHFSALRQQLLALRNRYRREPEGDEFSGVVPSADGNDDVLLTIQHVGHG
jgi:hypothetical protein